MMLSLTLKQARTKQFISDYMRDHGAAAPSYDAIADALDLKSKSSVHRLVNGLVDRGHLRHAKGGVRAMQIIEHLCCSNCGGTMISGPAMLPMAVKPRRPRSASLHRVLHERLPSIAQPMGAR
jgi:repressor LexA